MSAVAESFLVDHDTFFAPVSSDAVDSLVGQYQSMRGRIENVASLFAEEMNGVIKYFIAGNSGNDYGRMPSAEKLFSLDGAIADLNANYWQKTLSLTDVIEAMPQKRRDEWHEQIRKRTTPDFEEATVRSTLNSLLAMRETFFSEKVDGIFRSLSGEHVTNAPEGFRKRMIVANVLDSWGGVNYSRSGTIDDLRAVIAKFMGRDEPSHSTSSRTIGKMKYLYGHWIVIDGGSLRMRLYKKGTVHIEIHPDIAWRLNGILANLYPMAIPPKFRQKPEKKVKDFELMDRPLPFAVLNALDSCKIKGHTITFDYTFIKLSSIISDEVKSVISSIGGIATGSNSYEFNYDPVVVLNDIICSGCVPDYKTHQYYPTPLELAKKAVELAEIDINHTVLEPSAGQGGLADYLPNIDKVVCVEVSKLHCKILSEKGFGVFCEDFLKFSVASDFDRVVMNPPFSEGRWQAHVEAAAKMVKIGGKLVAILPASAKNRNVLPGWGCEFHGPFENEFINTSASVVILVASR